MGGRGRKKGGKGKGKKGGEGEGREGKGTSVAPPTSEGWRRHWSFISVLFHM